MPGRDRGLRVLRAVVSMVGVAIAASACGDDAGDAATPDQPEYEGLTRDQIETRAESMTPEQAESLGIIDTTIQIAPPMNPDTVLPIDGPRLVPDTLSP